MGGGIIGAAGSPPSHTLPPYNYLYYLKERYSTGRKTTTAFPPESETKWGKEWRNLYKQRICPYRSRLAACLVIVLASTGFACANPP